MLKVMRKADRTVPILCCDVCDSWIDDADYGAAVFPALSGEGEVGQAMIVHKGVCHDKAEATLRASGCATGWQELRRYLIDGLHNAGLSLEKMQDIQSDQDKFGHL